MKWQSTSNIGFEGMWITAQLSQAQNERHGFKDWASPNQHNLVSQITHNVEEVKGFSIIKKNNGEYIKKRT